MGFITKIQFENKNIISAIASTITEYDIKAAFPTALYYIKGKETYDDLMSRPKLERNTMIGKMFLTDKNLYPKIEETVRGFLNEFIDANNIKEDQVIRVWRDSFLLLSKIPRTTKFRDGMVNFQQKGESYSTIFRCNNKTILFDSMRREIDMINVSDETVKESPFIQQYLTPFIAAIEAQSSNGAIECLKIVKSFREKYIHSDNKSIYRELDNNNLFAIQTEDGDVLYSNSFSDDTTIQKNSNYDKYVMPIIRSVMRLR